MDSWFDEWAGSRNGFVQLERFKLDHSRVCAARVVSPSPPLGERAGERRPQFCETALSTHPSILIQSRYLDCYNERALIQALNPRACASQLSFLPNVGGGMADL